MSIEEQKQRYAVGIKMVLRGWKRPSQYTQIEEPEGGHVFVVRAVELVGGEAVFWLRRVLPSGVISRGSIESARWTGNELEVAVAEGSVVLLPGSAA